MLATLNVTNIIKIVLLIHAWLQKNRLKTVVAKALAAKLSLAPLPFRVSPIHATKKKLTIMLIPKSPLLNVLMFVMISPGLLLELMFVKLYGAGIL